MKNATTEALIQEIRNGRLVVLADDEDRENEGDLVMAAQVVTPEAINFMATHGRGLICLALTQRRCAELRLPPMVPENECRLGTAFTVSIDAATGVTTGISAADRALTIRKAVSGSAGPGDFRRPGHVFPLMARSGGVLERAGHTEAGCDFAQLAGQGAAAVICEVMNPDGTMARTRDLLRFAERHGLKFGTIKDLVAYRKETEAIAVC